MIIHHIISYSKCIKDAEMIDLKDVKLRTSSVMFLGKNYNSIPEEMFYLF